MNLIEFKQEVINIIRANIQMARDGLGPEHYLVPCGMSAPGVGKTAVFHEVVQELGTEGSDVFFPNQEPRHWELITHDLRTENPLDFAGMPYSEGKTSGTCRPDWIPKTGMKIIFLDELNQASTPILNVAATLIQIQKVGSHEMPRGCMIAAAGNPPKTVAGVRPMPEHTINRMVIFDIQADLNVWLLKATTSNVDPRIISFLMRKPERLEQKNRMTEPGPFPSPRAWIAASKLINLPPTPWTINQKNADKKNMEQHILRQRIASTVGQETANEFMEHITFLENFNDIKNIIQDPENAKIPKSLQEVAAICNALAENIQKTDKNFHSILTWTRRLQSSEWSAIMINIGAHHHDSIKQSREYIEFNSEISNIMMNEYTRSKEAA